ncbi:reverse transcriptase [Lasius niger]|uniref:Reverse transcriptase n=1 Tax=Lasius niger TaxID=67767 RepID=A0A0J7N7H9_LASNI|nr:reverse transcriptase [Lasius niger]
MGLRVAPQKTEAIFFHDGRRGKPPVAHVRVDDTPVQLGTSMKYLGLRLDGRWSYRDHVDRLVPKLDGMAAALTRLLPNLGGPGDRVRKLYANTVNSVALYGAPAWADEAVATRHIRDAFRRVQRRVAIRVVRGYRTVSHIAASVLAGLPPMELVARAHKRMYEQIKELRGLGVLVTKGTQGAVRLQARRQLAEEWREYLTSIPPTASGTRVVGAVGPVLEEWMDRPRGIKMSFHLTRVLSGHGCFGEYLCKIGKESTKHCHHCEEEDTAQHTLEHCPAWADERRVLTNTIGEDLSLPTVVRQMVGSEDNWKAVSSFCSNIMRQEEAERERERRGRRGRHALTPESRRERRSYLGALARKRSSPRRKTKVGSNPAPRRKTEGKPGPTIVKGDAPLETPDILRDRGRMGGEGYRRVKIGGSRRRIPP